MDVAEPILGEEAGGSRSTLPLRILGGGLAMGILGDGLLRASPWGVNLVFWIVALAALVSLLAPNRERLGRTIPFVAAALVFSVFVALRDSETLRALNVLAVLAALASAAWRARGLNLSRIGVSDYYRIGIAALRGVVSGSGILISQDVPLSEIRQKGWSRQVRSVLIGLLISVPLLFVFGRLLVSADAGFERFIQDTLDFDALDILVHLLIVAFWAWIATGYLRTVALETEEEPLPPLEQPSGLGLIELGIPLGLLNLLFLAFVAFQLPYLFGGSDAIMDTPGLTYSGYARRGFFELVIVVALVIPLLLLAHWALRRDGPWSATVFRVLAGIQLLLVAVIVASALHRMRLYQSAYGLTSDRFYATAFILWLFVLLVLFAGTVLAGHRERFAAGALVTGFAAILLLNLVNPDAVIARTNLTRAAEGKLFDVHHLTTLSADAVPTMLAQLRTADLAEKRPEIETTLRERWLGIGWTDGNRVNDWRTWNWSREAARRALEP